MSDRKNALGVSQVLVHDAIGDADIARLTADEQKRV